MWPMSTYHHGDLPAALLKAAGKALEQKGIASLSLRDAARRAGVSHNAPYRHFADREALLAALAAEGFAMLADRLRGRQGAELGMAYVQFALEHPQRFRLMFAGMSGDGAEQAYRMVRDAFKELPRADVAAAAAWSLMHGLAQLLLEGHLPEGSAREVLGAVRFAVAPQRSG
jgi:AcrR family transcriptional regulator